MPAPPPSSARQRARCSSAALADEYAGGVLARHERVLGRDEHDRAADVLLPQDPERLARDEEVAGDEDVVVAVPLVERRLLDRGARRDAGVGDEDVDAAVARDRRGERPGHRLLAGDVAADREAVVAVGRDRVLRALLVEVERDDARAGLGERVADRAADPARARRSRARRGPAARRAAAPARACRARAASTRSRSSRRRRARRTRRARARRPSPRSRGGRGRARASRPWSWAPPRPARGAGSARRAGRGRPARWTRRGVRSTYVR